MYKTKSSKKNLGKTPSGNSIYWLLTKETGAKNFELRYVEIPVNGHTSYGHHPHEHEAYVIKGQGEVRGDDYKERLLPGDAVFIPGNEEHQWINKGDVDFGFICVVPVGAEAESKPKSS